MKTTRFVIAAALAGTTLFCFGCAGQLPAHTYWLKNPETGTYSAHKTYSPLSDDEVRELNLVKELPADAKVID